jgi:hypothetical protein
MGALGDGHEVRPASGVSQIQAQRLRTLSYCLLPLFEYTIIIRKCTTGNSYQYCGKLTQFW